MDEMLFSVNVRETSISFNKVPTSYNTLKMGENDQILKELYSDTFQPVFYSKGDIPQNYLPYGLIYDRNKYTDKSHISDINQWTTEIYEDCLKYVKAEEQSRTEWYFDFILFTNLQIALYNNPKLIKDTEEIKILTNYACKEIKNLRSSVARNSHLFVGCLAFCLENQHILSDFAIRVLPSLLVSAGSSKSVYTQSSISNLKILVSKCYTFNQDILFIFLDYSSNLNKKISQTAAEFMYHYYTNTGKDDLESFDVSRFVKSLEILLNSPNVEVKRWTKQLVVSLPLTLPKHILYSFLEESSKFQRISEILKNFN